MRAIRAALPLRPVQVIGKPIGARCNLNCAYCFYLAKDELYPGSRFCMSEEVQDAFVREYLASQPDGEVTLAWQGGEPTLMGLGFFRRVVELAEQHWRPGRCVRHTIQTNGTLLSDDWGRFFKEHGWLVGLSLDGPKDLHDAYRVDKANKPTFGRAASPTAGSAGDGAALALLPCERARLRGRGRTVMAG